MMCLLNTLEYRFIEMFFLVVARVSNEEHCSMENIYMNVTTALSTVVGQLDRASLGLFVDRNGSGVELPTLD